MLLIVLILVASLASGADDEGMPGKAITAESFMVANTLWTLLHETAHAAIDELDILFLGSEEDAADQLATIALLRGEPDFALPDSLQPVDVVIAAATAWRIEWELEKHQETTPTYWDSHSLSIQRFYNMMCLLFGSHPDQYDKVERQLNLPYERAYSCLDYDNEHAMTAVDRIIETYGRQENSVSKQTRVSVVYEATYTEEQQRMATIMKNSGVAKLVAHRIETMLALPDDITIVFAQCANDPTAFWHSERKEIVICYELLSRFLYLHQVNQCLEAAGISGKEIEDCLR
ncbi:hypothetical protein DWB85_18300 [Seongchinamella sediminis]|uniref:Metallopeptidase n=1 Tax=Seongchinamella sediminis TaxID=2283635 RepID=A0A3L7DUV7_9GAMM|nr:hypothetical protein DWB85_18300 [Seongchinamella sediminis]